MLRCKTCVMPDTRPDTPFYDGECAACVSFKARQQITPEEWIRREQSLKDLLDRHDGRVLVPSSGGKDSHYQVKRMLDLGAEVTVVTATTCHLTEIGRKNIDNLARYAHQTIEVTPNKEVRKKLNRAGLEKVGDVSYPEHVAIFTIPSNIAAATNHTLMMYGENPQQEYGGPPGKDQALQLTRRWVAEFGGQLGLRPADLVGYDGITARDMEPYMLSQDALGALANDMIEAHFLGAYERWDSHRNGDVARQMGMDYACPTAGNWWSHENLDNAQTGLHDHMMFRKYGFGRGCQQISVDVRNGIVERSAALAWVEACDGLFPWQYCEVAFDAIPSAIGMHKDHVMGVIEQFTDWDLFAGQDEDLRPIFR